MPRLEAVSKDRREIEKEKGEKGGEERKRRKKRERGRWGGGGRKGERERERGERERERRATCVLKVLQPAVGPGAGDLHYLWFPVRVWLPVSPLPPLPLPCSLPLLPSLFLTHCLCPPLPIFLSLSSSPPFLHILLLLSPSLPPSPPPLFLPNKAALWLAFGNSYRNGVGNADVYATTAIIHFVTFFLFVCLLLLKRA